MVWAFISIVLSGLTCYGLFLVVRSFGQYARALMADNARTRQSCEESAQRVIRTERRIADDEMATIELVREMMKSYHQERSA